MSEPTARVAQIAHVLFLDMVAFSRASTTGQGRLLEQLNAVVAASATYAAAKAAGSVHENPTGDGMALLFYGDVFAPAQCAVEVTRALGGSGAVPVRMGIHSGLVQTQMDITGRETVVGEGINTAQRVMDFGDAGHILLSAQYAGWLGQFDDWAPSIHRLGEGVAKYGQKVELYCLHGPDYGRGDPPARLGTAPAGTVPVATAPAASARKVALLYKPSLQPDEDVLRTLQAQLEASGHEVFVDNQQKINAVWAQAIEEPIRRADAVIAIVSPRSLRSEMLEFEIETAHDQQLSTGKPVILPVIIGEAEPLDAAIGPILQPLTQFVWRGPQDDQRLIAELCSAIAEPQKPSAAEVKLEPVGGAVPPDSPFYVQRATDQEFMAALEARESLLLVKGARQIGKTSMLAQGTRRARELGWRCGLTDFQKVNTTQLADEERFYRLLAASLARQLQFGYDFASEWDEIFGANLNMENFVRALLEARDEHLVWFMDEVDKLFTAPFASDFFGLVRSWHNSRSTEAGGPWQKLTVVIAYATEAHLFIQDLNQSPFNVGRRLDLEDFNLQQTIDLNGRYGGPLLSYAECEALHALIEGQPFLTRRALDALATERCSLSSLIEQAARETGPFGDHLQRILVATSRLPEVTEYVKAILAGGAPPNQDAYYRLLSAGIIKQNQDGQVSFRCALYRRYLQAHLQ